MFNPIVIVEGPAGCGKSTVSKHLVEKTGLKLVSGSLPERTPKPHQAPTLSWFNDLQKITQALSNSGSVVDRWGLSQAVYGSLRRADSQGWEIPKTPSVPENHLLTLEQNVKALYHDLAWRSTLEGHDRPPTPSILILVLLPPVQVISHRRRECGRTFQWDAGAEYQLYSNMPRRVGMLIRRVVFLHDHNPNDKALAEVMRLIQECHRV